MTDHSSLQAAELDLVKSGAFTDAGDEGGLGGLFGGAELPALRQQIQAPGMVGARSSPSHITVPSARAAASVRHD